MSALVRTISCSGNLATLWVEIITFTTVRLLVALPVLPTVPATVYLVR